MKNDKIKKIMKWCVILAFSLFCIFLLYDLIYEMINGGIETCLFDIDGACSHQMIYGFDLLRDRLFFVYIPIGFVIIVIACIFSILINVFALMTGKKKKEDNKSLFEKISYIIVILFFIYLIINFIL
ncbi:MAG: hypothetical protein PUD59_03585 [bacterium]|nr:hypothetical protein [bacterium]